MSDEIVARLRVWSDWLNERCPDTEVRNDLRAAADEIERLREERNEAEPLLNELWERRTEATEMRSEIERLRADRDEARREVCEKEETLGCDERGVPRNGSARDHAKRRGWDCFKEASDER